MQIHWKKLSRILKTLGHIYDKGFLNFAQILQENIEFHVITFAKKMLKLKRLAQISTP